MEISGGTGFAARGPPVDVDYTPSTYSYEWGYQVKWL